MFFSRFRIALIKKMLNFFAMNNELSKHFYKARRHHLSSHICLNNLFVDGQESYWTLRITNGLFAGMTYIGNQQSWFDSFEVLMQKQSGIYEQEILDFFSKSNYSTIIDVGAGAGYYSLGLLFSKKCQKAILFEVDQQYPPIIRTLARINDISEEQFSIFGAADKSAITSILSSMTTIEKSKTVMICDIEGKEFDLFDSDLIHHLAASGVTLLIEIHKNRTSRIIDFQQVLKLYYDVRLLPTMRRDLTDSLVELPLITDRWLMVSENRDSCQVLAIPQKSLK